MFEGFPEETIRFFLELRFHNDAAFFHSHQEEYEQFVRKPFYDFIDAAAPAALKLADDIEVRPAKCLCRIHRDTRFTKDKSPYRDHLWLLFRRACEPRENSVMYWFELSPESVAWGLGFWSASRPVMDQLRKLMCDKPEEFIKTLQKCRIPAQGLMPYGARYSRMKAPEGLPVELAPYYPMKELYIQRSDVPLRTVYTPEIVKLFTADLLRLKPMYTLLRKAADSAMAALDA